MKKKTKTIKYYEGVGRRKSSVARVRLYIASSSKKAIVGKREMDKGEIIINETDWKKYLPVATWQKLMLRPFELTGSEDRFAVSIKVSGGGKNGQLGAIIHGLSRALLLVDEGYRPVLKKAGLLTRDPRAKERRKVGTGGKARRKKQSPKR